MPGTIQSIERAAGVLRLLAGRSRRLGVVDLAGELGLNKATVHGILRTLQREGFVEQDPDSGKYQLGAALLHLGASYLEGNELRTRAMHPSEALAARSGETVRIGTLHDGRVLVVGHVRPPDDSRPASDVGALLPAHACALGKVLLARDAAAAERAGAAGLTAYTRTTITDPGRLRRELEAVARRGWADDREEMVHGEVSLAAAIEDRRGVAIGAIGVSGPVERLLEEGSPAVRLVVDVRETARELSRDLGAIPG